MAGGRRNSELASAHDLVQRELPVRRAPARKLALLLVGAAVTASLAGCRPLYLPAIPAEIPYTPQVRTSSDNVIEFGANGYPSITLALLDVTTPGWLSVQWLAPNGSEVASQSVWVEARPEQSVRFVLPADVELRPGDWRAVVTLQGRLVRQLNFTIELPD